MYLHIDGVVDVHEFSSGQLIFKLFLKWLIFSLMAVRKLQDFLFLFNSVLINKYDYVIEHNAH